MGIVTNGLIGYWHYQQGINGAVWENISPNTVGSYNGTINGATLQSDGMYFDGIDDFVNFVNMGISNTSFTVEVRGEYKGKSGYLIIKEFSHRIGFWNTNIVQSIFNGGGFANSPVGSISTGSKYHLTYRYDKARSTEEVFINGSLKATRTGATTTNLNTDFQMAKSGSNSTIYEGLIPYLRIYNRALSNEEITNNYNEGMNVGLVTTPVSSPPIVSNINVDNYKISHIVGFDITTVKFIFDKDVSEWKVKLLGASHDTGTLLESGTSLTAGAEGFAVVNSSDLLSEGQNRINIYGKDAEGSWTPYEG